MSPVDSPSAPSSIACSTSATMRASSAGVGLARAEPHGAGAHRAVRHQVGEVEPGAAIEQRQIVGDAAPRRASHVGIAEQAGQLLAHLRRRPRRAPAPPRCRPGPSTSSVMPCITFIGRSGSTSTRRSECECVSMKPGATCSPSASMTRARPSTVELRLHRRRCGRRAPARRPRRAGAPVPSTTMPPRMRTLLCGCITVVVRSHHFWTRPSGPYSSGRRSR